MRASGTAMNVYDITPSKQVTENMTMADIQRLVDNASDTIGQSRLGSSIYLVGSKITNEKSGTGTTTAVPTELTLITSDRDLRGRFVISADGTLEVLRLCVPIRTSPEDRSGKVYSPFGYQRSGGSSATEREVDSDSDSDHDPLAMDFKDMNEKQISAALTTLVQSKFEMDGWVTDKVLIAFVVGELRKDKAAVMRSIKDHEVTYWPTNWPKGRQPVRRAQASAAFVAASAPYPSSSHSYHPAYFPYGPPPPGYGIPLPMLSPAHSPAGAHPSPPPQPAPPADVQPPPPLPPPPAGVSAAYAAAEEDKLYDIAIARLERLRAVGGISEQEYTIGKSNLTEKYLGVSLKKNIAPS